MNCPHCAAVLPDDDVFCEECGERMSDQPTPAATLCLCGAPDGQLDEDGYCLACGRRCRPAPGEHEEAELSADFAAISDRGLRHARNEDRFQIASEPGRAVLVVCDGVSSSASADHAAEAASKGIAEALLASVDLTSAFQQAAETVSKLAGAMNSEQAPSTSAVAATVEGKQVAIGWLGDSRACWISETEPRQLTVDHSWLNDVVSAGEMNYAEAAQAPQAHGITRWLGADADVETAAETTCFEIPGPGWLLLCTDGLWNYAPEVGELARLVLSQPAEASALEVARHLIAYANEQGGHDNVTVALLRFN